MPPAEATARVLDGRALARTRRAALKAHIAKLAAQRQTPKLTPKLAVVLVGDDAASAVYVRNKRKACAEVGIQTMQEILPASTSEAELLAAVAALNRDASVHGILVQFPVPPQIAAARVMAAIAPQKDVDGLHPLNQARLVMGEPGLRPCTPQACVLLAQEAEAQLRGLHAVIVGRSLLVGKPLAHLLLEQDCTVSVAHSRTRNLPALVGSADVLVAACGRAAFVRGAWLKSGAIVIDVGINRVDGRLVGDVADDAAARAGALTPVPGGVGPMTVTCLLENTVRAAEQQAAARS